MLHVLHLSPGRVVNMGMSCMYKGTEPEAIWASLFSCV